MKKLLMIMIACLLLASCTEVIDKKITKESFIEDFKQIKDKFGSTYTQEDFNSLDSKAMSVFMGNNIDKTYREVLDNAKEKRIVIEKENAEKQKVEKERLEKLNKAIKMTIGQTENIKGDNRCVWAIEGKFSNTSGKEIKAFRGDCYIIDSFSDTLKIIPVECTELIKANATISSIMQTEIDKYIPKESKMIDLKPADVKILFAPSKIVFSDNTSIE